MKIVENIDKNDVINYLLSDFDVYAFDTVGSGLLNLRYEYFATVNGIIENDNFATFIVRDDAIETVK